MSELQATILCLPILVVSIWGLQYFAVRIAWHFWIRSELGDMPSSDEISALYESNNAIVEYRNFDGLNHSPTDDISPERG